MTIVAQIKPFSIKLKPFKQPLSEPLKKYICPLVEGSGYAAAVRHFLWVLDHRAARGWGQNEVAGGARGARMGIRLRMGTEYGRFAALYFGHFLLCVRPPCLTAYCGANLLLQKKKSSLRMHH